MQKKEPAVPWLVLGEFWVLGNMELYVVWADRLPGIKENQWTGFLPRNEYRIPVKLPNILIQKINHNPYYWPCQQCHDPYTEQKI